MRRIAPATTSGLLLGSALFVVLGARQRWSAACPVGGDWNFEACIFQQNHQNDVLLPSSLEPWTGDHRAAVLVGIGYVLLACAILLVPAAFAMGARPWQWAAIGLTAPSMLGLGITTTQSGRLGRVVDAPGLLVFVAAVLLPAALFLLLWRPHADSPPLGARRGAVVSLLALCTPFLHALVVSRLHILYSSHDTAPWSEAAIAPLLVVAALLLKPWRVPAPQSSFSNQRLAHGLSL